MESIEPNIFEYADFRAYLKDFQKVMKIIKPGLSGSEICRRMGLPNTRGFFRDLINGRKCSPDVAERLSRALEHTKDEMIYFKTLVKFNQADTVDDRELYFDQLVSLNRAPKKIVDTKVYAYYREWYHSVIRAILEFFDFNDDFSSLAKKIRPQISVKQARESIQLLSELNLITRDKDGFFRPTDKSLTTGPYSKNELIRQFQLKMLKAAESSMLRPRADNCNFSTMTLSMSKENYARVEKRLQKFKNEIRSLVYKESTKAEGVFQLCIQLFQSSN